MMEKRRLDRESFMWFSCYMNDGALGVNVQRVRLVQL